MSRKKTKAAPTRRQRSRKEPKGQQILNSAEAAGAAHAAEQIEGEYFRDWVRDQLIEASRMPPEKVLPLETKDDAKQIARNMLKQLEWDAKRDSNESREFFKGFSEYLQRPEVRDWLADEILEIDREIKGSPDVSERVTSTRDNIGAPWLPPSVLTQGVRIVGNVAYSGDLPIAALVHGHVFTVHYEHMRDIQVRHQLIIIERACPDAMPAPDLVADAAGVPVGDLIHPRKKGDDWSAKSGHRVRDYIAVDSRGRTIAGPFQSYSAARGHADRARGHVQFVPKRGGRNQR